MPPESPFEPVPQSPHYVPRHPAQNPGTALASASAATSPANTNDYSFIFDPPKPAKTPLLPGGNLWQRSLLALGALILLIVIVSVIKSLFAGSSNLAELTTVAQDQQELIHLTTNTVNPGQQRINTSATTNNVAITAKLALSSAQSDLLKYLKTNGRTIDVKILNQKVNLATDAQLTAAASAGNYDATFAQVISGQLTSYQNHLKLAYAKTTGLHGRALLSKEYTGAQLLVTQLNSPNE